MRRKARTAMLSVRFKPKELDALREASDRIGFSIGEIIRAAAIRELLRSGYDRRVRRPA